MGNACAILLPIVFSYRCPATHRRRTLPVLYRIPHALIDGRFSIGGAYRDRFPAKTWKAGPRFSARSHHPAARHAWPVVRDCCRVARGAWPVVVAPWPALRGAWLLAHACRGLIRAPWRVARGACAVVRVGGPESLCPFAKVSAHFAAIPGKWPTCLGAGALARFHTNNHSRKTNVLLIY